MATRIVDTGLTTSAVITGGTSTPSFPSSVGLPIGAALSELGVTFSLLTLPMQKIYRSQTVKQGKHNVIMQLDQSKLDSITDIISQAIQDGEISPAEFHNVLQEVEKYRKLKNDIRNKTKAKVKQVEKEKWEEIFEPGRKEGREDFLQQTANFSGTQGAKPFQI